MAASASVLAPTTKESNPMAKTDRVHSTPRRTALKIVAGTTARQADPYDEAFLKQYDPALRAINAHRQAVKIHIEGRARGILHPRAT